MKLTELKLGGIICNYTSKVDDRRCSKNSEVGHTKSADRS